MCVVVVVQVYVVVWWRVKDCCGGECSVVYVWGKRVRFYWEWVTNDGVKEI